MPGLLEKKIGGREKIEEGGEEIRGREKMKGRRQVFYKAEAGVGNADFLKLRNRRWECRLLIFFKIQKPALEVPAIEIFLKTDVINAGHCHLYPNALVWLYF